jgi:hypothetical protein
MKKRKKLINLEEAKRIGDSLYMDWDRVDLKQFRQGLIECQDTDDGMFLPGKVVLAHVQEFPDYFARLEKLKAEFDEYQARFR